MQTGTHPRKARHTPAQAKLIKAMEQGDPLEVVDVFDLYRKRCQVAYCTHNHSHGFLPSMLTVRSLIKRGAIVEVSRQGETPSADSDESGYYIVYGLAHRQTMQTKEREKNNEEI